MSTGASAVDQPARPAIANGLRPKQKAKARRHIAAVAEAQRAARGSVEHVSMPGVRRTGRRLDLIRVWCLDRLERASTRLADSHKFPGRLLSRARLYRPTETISRWVILWFAIAVGCGIFAFTHEGSQPAEWISKWALGAAFAALIATLWHDGFKSPFTAARIRRQIISNPSRLLKLTLGEQTMKVIELDPPLNTVPRDELYEELLPGVLARTKDIQIIVGDPGAGKTTALLDLASILARIGFVPVLLQLRGECTSEDLFEVAKKRFETQVRPLVRMAGDADVVWRWLCRRQRLVILVDDIDQIGFDGEPGFLMRRLLEDLAPERQPVIVTARPSGVPAGIAASAIPMEPLEFETAVDIVAQPKKREPGATTEQAPSPRRIASWVRAGELRVAPLYLEALAEMTAVGVCPDLPEDPKGWVNPRRPGRVREASGQKREWNPIWIRYLLLKRFHERIENGHVRRSQAIDVSDRRRCLRALEGAALGVLGAAGLDAVAAANPEAGKRTRPQRRNLVDFISCDDRRGFERVGERSIPRRLEVSQHEAIDTGERLRILDRDQHQEPQFRHRIMQAFFAGRYLAELGRDETRRQRATDVAGRVDGKPRAEKKKTTEKPAVFDEWVEILMDHHHPERLTAHLALTFAAIHADARYLVEHDPDWDGLGDRIARRLVSTVGERGETTEPDPSCGSDGEIGLGVHLDPRHSPDPYDRRDPDDNLVKLTTAANVATLLRTDEKGGGRSTDLPAQILALLDSAIGSMRWTKQQALLAIAALDTKEAWAAVWTRFARDPDYEVRRSAGRQLERYACCAFADLCELIEEAILRAGHRASEGLPLGEPADGWTADDVRTFEALGWVLPAIVSGLGEELSDGQEEGSRRDPAAVDGRRAKTAGESAERFRHARSRLEELVTLAFEGGRAKLEDSLAQGFKADAMRHAAGPSGRFTGPGWVAGNRRLVADVAIPHAESWYARMLLYQSLVLYAITGTGREDTLDILSYRMHACRERHPFTRQAAKLAHAALRRADIRSDRWKAYIWSDDVEDAGVLPASLGRRATQLVGDVTVLVDLKEGSPPDRHGKFGYMEELPYCLSGSRDRHEILGAGCPDHCGWGFCPYRAAAPDEPNEHRGISRGFSRGQKRAALQQRPPAWQEGIRTRKMYEFWRQMEFKARR